MSPTNSPAVTTAFHQIMLERCDACPAPAKLEITLLSRKTLRFCAYHYREHQHEIEPVMWTWEEVS